MIRSALQRLAGVDPPNRLSRRIPDGVWNWAFQVTADEALMQKAVFALEANPGITVYDFIDGQEFNRHSASGPFAELRRSMEGIAEGIAKMAEHVDAMFAGLRAHHQDVKTLRFRSTI